MKIIKKILLSILFIVIVFSSNCFAKENYKSFNSNEDAAKAILEQLEQYDENKINNNTKKSITIPKIENEKNTNIDTIVKKELNIIKYITIVIIVLIGNIFIF